MLTCYLAKNGPKYGEWDMGDRNCRQNSNLLITYLFFTFVRGVWRGGWGRQVGFLAKTGCLSGGAQETPPLNFGISYSFNNRQKKTAFHRVFPWRVEASKASCFVNISETFNHRTQRSAASINLHSAWYDQMVTGYHTYKASIIKLFSIRLRLT